MTSETVQEPMTIEYRITRPHYKEAFNEATARRSAMGRAAIYVLPVLGGLMTLIGLAFLVLERDFIASATFFALGAFWFFYRDYCIRRCYRLSKNLEKTFTAVVRDDGLELSSPTARSEMTWATFVGFAETTNIFVLFHSAILFNVFPKSAFSPDALEQFRTVLKTHVPTADFRGRGDKIRVAVFWFVVVLAGILLWMVIHKNS